MLNQQGEKTGFCCSVCIIIRVLCLGPNPAPQPMEIYFWGKKEGASDWTSWVILQLLHFRSVRALVEIGTQSSLSSTPLISLVDTDLYRRSLQRSKCLVIVTKSSHSKNERIFYQGDTRSQRRKKWCRWSGGRSVQWLPVDLHLHHKTIIFPSTKGQQGWQPARPRSKRHGQGWESGALAELVRDGSHIASTSETLGSRLRCSSLTFKSAKRFSLLSVGGDQTQFK